MKHNQPVQYIKPTLLSGQVNKDSLRSASKQAALTNYNVCEHLISPFSKKNRYLRRMATGYIMDSSFSLSTLSNRGAASKRQLLSCARHSVLFGLPAANSRWRKKSDIKKRVQNFLLLLSYWCVADPQPDGSQPTPTLSNLPPELHLKIFDFLNPATSTCLGLTCKNFYSNHRWIHGSVSLSASDDELTYHTPNGCQIVTCNTLYLWVTQWAGPNHRFWHWAFVPRVDEKKEGAIKGKENDVSSNGGEKVYSSPYGTDRGSLGRWAARWGRLGGGAE